MSVSTMHQPPMAGLKIMGITNPENIHYQLTPAELAEQTIQRGEGTTNNTGALVIKTGEFTGRSPKDKFIVKDAQTSDTVHWNDFNIPVDENKFDSVYKKMLAHLN